MDESKLIGLIKTGNLASGEQDCANQMHYSFFVIKDKKQVKLAYWSYQGYLSNLNANANAHNIFVNQELMQEMENLFINSNSLPNQKE